MTWVTDTKDGTKVWVGSTVRGDVLDQREELYELEKSKFKPMPLERKVSDEDYLTFGYEAVSLLNKLPVSWGRADAAIVSAFLRNIAENAATGERERCLDICAAEREWGGNIDEVQERIDKGMEPRQIPGWNGKSKDD